MMVHCNIGSPHVLQPMGEENPFMSAWLSAANSLGGSARAQATAQARRSAATAASNATSEWLKLWTGTPVKSLSTRRKRRR